MCEANAYLRVNGKEDVLMENVDILRPERGGLFLQNIFGEQKWVEAKIEEMNLVGHRIILASSKVRKSRKAKANE
ncbi:MAG: CooT family nickel-binding protein [Syntrophobacteraceae bacterium]|jgi:predicted RNA-binding protein